MNQIFSVTLSLISGVIKLNSSSPIDNTEERSMTLCLICLHVNISSCVCMGITTEAWAALLTIRVGLFEGLTAGIEAACGGGKVLGWVDTIGISLVLGGKISDVSLELTSSLIQPRLLVIFTPSKYTAYTIPIGIVCSTTAHSFTVTSSYLYYT